MTTSIESAISTSDQRSVNFWIVNWWQDLLWFVAPPLFLVPLFAMLLQRMPLEQLSLLVVTFGAVGHHLPGMIRAYGDTQLFQRYRIRFIVAPIFLLTVSIYYSYHRPDALGVLLVLWGFWHSQAQVYGFLRIYDSKVGQTDQSSVWVDRLLCVSWFGGAIAMSDGRLTDFLKVYYRSGGVSVNAGLINTVRLGLMGLMAVSLALFLFRLLTLWKAGSSPNPVKLLSIALSIGFWWYCMVGVRNVILGVALYEVFHDIQYLAIVWFFNRRRVTTGKSPGWVTRFLFQPRIRLVVLYVALVVAYGAGSLLTKNLDASVLQTVLSGLFAASGFLHFYYDGFIWRIRDKDTSETLGVVNFNRPAALIGNLSQYKHATLWLLFVIPLIVLSVSSESSDVHGQVVQSLPDSDDAHLNYASELLEMGELSQAEHHARIALNMNADWSKPWHILGEISLARNDPKHALGFFDKAIEFEPFNAITQFNRGDALIKLNRIPEGVAAYEEASRLDPTYESSAFNNLGVALLSSGAPEDAENAFQQAIASDPSDLDARLNLAQTLSQLQRYQEATEIYRDVISNRPDYSPPYASLVQLLIMQQRFQAAEQVIARHQKYFLGDITGDTLEGFLLLSQNQLSSAETSFQSVLQIDPHDFKARYGLTQLRIQQNRISDAQTLVNEMEHQSPLSRSQFQMIRQLRRHIAQSQLAE
jgi:tetratricopeptide (TPR) repeat protein